MDFDFVIINGTIVDGTGRSRFGADLVLFDAATVAGHATLEQPDVLPVGIRAVLIKGQVVAQDGQMVGNGRWGQVLRR